jgi:hypothetical protein
MLLLLSTAWATECPAELTELLSQLDADAHHCPTTVLGALGERAQALDATACLTQELTLRGLPTPGPALDLPPGPPAPNKATRDAYNTPNSLESDNFVLRWGNRDFDEDDAASILEGFENAWSGVLEDMAYAAPDGTDSYKFNVYMGSTGNGAPQEYGAAYYTRDNAGHPMIVVSRNTPGGGQSYMASVAVHEFYHALQDAAESPYQYDSSSPGAWYWEATANWIETELYPGNWNVAYFIVGYAFMPQLPIHYFNYPDTGSWDEYHQYGAFIFPYYMTHGPTDALTIRRSWLEATSSDPLRTLDAVLQDRGHGSIDQAFFDFAAANATWDYPGAGAQDLFSDTVASYCAQYSSDCDYIAASHSGTFDWTSVDNDLRPQRYGTNFIELRSTEGELELELDAEGSRGSLAEWDVRVIQPNGDQRQLEVSGGHASTDLTGMDDAMLVVSVVTPAFYDGETFDYSYRVALPMPNDTDSGFSESGPDTDDTSDTDVVTAPPPEIGAGGCGCGGGTLGGGAWVLGLLVFARRRQR